MASLDSGLTPGQRRTRARAAAFAMHAQGRTNTKPALEARLAADERAVDPEGILDPAERARRAAQHRRARMTLLSLKASRARGHRLAAPAVETGAASAEGTRDASSAA